MQYCPHTHTHAHIHTHSRAHTHTHTLAHTHSHTYTHTRTHFCASCMIWLVFMKNWSCSLLFWMEAACLLMMLVICADGNCERTDVMLLACRVRQAWMAVSTEGGILVEMADMRSCISFKGRERFLSVLRSVPTSLLSLRANSSSSGMP